MNIDELAQAAIRKQQEGNLDDAEKLYKEILRVRPDHFHALHYLGTLYCQQGKYELAIEHINKSLLLNPFDPQAQYNLGIALQGKGDFDDAIASYQKAVGLNPKNADAYVNLGIIFKEKGQIDEAMSYYQKALEIDADHIAALYNLGYIYQTKNLIYKAIDCYKRTLNLNPNLIAVYYNLGYIYRQKGNLDEAKMCFEEVIRLNPNFADAYNALGVISQENGRLDTAIEYFEKALQLNPYLVDSYNNLGLIYQEKEQYDEAIAYYRKAIQINPVQAEIYTNLGNALHSQGKQDDAMAAYDRAIEQNPNSFTTRWARCFSRLPIIYNDFASIQTARKLYFDDLISLSNTISLETLQNIYEADAIGSRQPFFLAYQGLNDRDLQKIYGELVCKIMAKRYPQFSENTYSNPFRPGEPLRVGIVSAFFYRHSNWKIPIKGWVENIDKKNFHLYGYYTGKTRDEETIAAGPCFSRFVEGCSSLKEMCEIIRNDNLHVLLYPEIGMDPMTVRLAALRLAPVQCTSWGHPDTSGLPTIDYFLSSDLMEPPDANDHYTEKLIRLPNLSVYYTPNELGSISLSRDKLGLPEKSVLFLCCQSLFKYLPQYDEVFPRIARQLSDCRFLFISHRSEWVTGQFLSRLKQAFYQHNLNADDYIVILPRVDQVTYQAINRLADVYLDSIGWSGCNTTLEAIECNLPVVTLPGDMMRGRHSSAILEMMGEPKTIATTADEYIDIAVKLGNDREWRRDISEKVAANKHRVYRDKTCIAGLEDFLVQAAEKKS